MDVFELDQREAEQKRIFDEAAAGFSPEVRAVFRALFFERQYLPAFCVCGEDLQIRVDDSEALDTILVLHRASGVPEGIFHAIDLGAGTLTRQGDIYLLTGEAQNYEEERAEPFSIRFFDATVKTTVYRADAQEFGETPWMHLCGICREILAKCFTPGSLLNERERELLPLIAEIGRLAEWSMIPEEYQKETFPLLRSHIADFGYWELLSYVARREKEFFQRKKEERATRALLSRLNKQKYEPLWRKLYGLLVESQKGYPPKASVCCAEEAEEARREISRLLGEQGYTGAYPDFVKTGSIRGLRLAEAYGQSHFIAAEKRAVYHIHCTEVAYSGRLMIEMLCGTELLKKGEEPGDVYSCTFDAKGRRLFKTVTYEKERMNMNGEVAADDLEARCRIAVKRTELLALTKEEQKELFGFDFSWKTIFLWAFMVMGGLFGLLMIAGMMLLSALICLLVGQPGAILEMLTELPWGKLFLLVWLLFGGSMGAITVLAKRR